MSPTAINLPPEQRRALRRKAHALKVIVSTGTAGLTDAVVKEIDQALKHHELMKVRLLGVDRKTRDQMAESVRLLLAASLVQQVGFVYTLYRKIPEKKPTRKKKTGATSKAYRTNRSEAPNHGAKKAGNPLNKRRGR